MNPLIRKEVRSILPAWMLAMLLAIVPAWLVWPGPHGLLAQNPRSLVFAPFGLGVLLLSLAPFGQELNWGTFSILLAQPVSRRRLWRVKTVVLATALGVVFVALSVSFHLRVASVLAAGKATFWPMVVRHPEIEYGLLRQIADAGREAFRDALTVGGLSSLAGFAGGLWTTLLFRQASTAFWLTLVVPLGLGLLTGQLLGGFSEAVVQAGLFLVLGLYAAGGFYWAKQSFMDIQDVAWTGGAVLLPGGRRSPARALSGGWTRKQRPLGALVRKEWASQHINLLLAGGLLLLHLAMLALRKAGADYLAAHRSKAMILDSFPIIWLAMPLLVGSVVVAEERKLGTLESVSCLPATRRLQFVTKLAVALLLGVLLGGVLPLLLEGLGTLIGLRPNSTLAIRNNVLSLVAVFLAGSAGTTLLAFYASTLSRNTLQALGGGVMATVLAGLVIDLADFPHFDGVVLWRGPLLGCLSWPVMVSVVVLLAYGNYQRLAPDVRTWLQNGKLLLMAMVGVAAVTTVLYHRAWESWLPEEPLHESPWLYHAGWNLHLANAPRVQATPFRTAVLLPDGRLWLRQRRGAFRPVPGGRGRGLVLEPTGRWQAGFLLGSGWRDVAAGGRTCFAIRSDGSLWDLSDCEPGKPEDRSRLIRVGESQDWTQVAAGSEYGCGLKADGTLWEWGSRSVRKGKKVSLEKLPGPVRVGADHDWVASAAAFDRSVAAKADGSIWRWRQIETHDPTAKGATVIDYAAEPQSWLALSGGRPTRLSFNGWGIAAVCKDGSLWVGADTLARWLRRELPEATSLKMVRWGSDSDWRQVELVGWSGAVAIKRDGSMWQPEAGPLIGLGPARLEPPALASHYAAWLCASADGNAYLALAYDGTLCEWGDPEDNGDYALNGYRNGPDPQRLLFPSRIRARTVADLSRP